MVILYVPFYRCRGASGQYPLNIMLVGATRITPTTCRGIWSLYSLLKHSKDHEDSDHLICFVVFLMEGRARNFYKCDYHPKCTKVPIYAFAARSEPGPPKVAAKVSATVVTSCSLWNLGYLSADC